MLDGDDKVLLGLLDAILHGDDSAIPALFDLITERKQDDGGFLQLPDVRDYHIWRDEKYDAWKIIDSKPGEENNRHLSTIKGWIREQENVQKKLRLEILYSFGFYPPKNSWGEMRTGYLEWPKLIYKQR